MIQVSMLIKITFSNLRKGIKNKYRIYEVVTEKHLFLVTPTSENLLRRSI